MLPDNWTRHLLTMRDRGAQVEHADTVRATREIKDVKSSALDEPKHRSTLYS